MLKRMINILLACLLILNGYILAYGDDISIDEETGEEVIEDVLDNDELIPDTDTDNKADESDESDESADASNDLEDDTSADVDENIPESEEVENVLEQTSEYKLLKALGIINNEVFSSNTVITRAELMKYLSIISGVNNISEKTYAGSFTDVNDSTPFFQHIKVMEDLGVISGNGNGKFYPENYISYVQAVTAAVKLLGHHIFAEDKGGYPSGYLAAAQTAGITNGIAPDSNGNLSGKNILTFMVNVLMTDVVNQESYNNQGRIDIVHNGSFAETVYSLYKGEGIIEANEFTGITESDNAVTEGCVKINNTIYQAPNVDVTADIGKKIIFYAEHDKKGAELPEILWYELDKNVKIVTLDARDINRVSNYSVVSGADNQKEKQYNFNGLTNVVYNYKAFPEYKADDINIKMGTVTLVDNNNDNIYEFINVISYTEFMVQSVGTESEIIYGTNDEIIPLPKHTNGYKVFRGGESVELSEVYSGTVINLIIAPDNSYCVIFADGISVSGTVNEVRAEENITYVVIDGNEYVLSALASYVPKATDYGTFYLNAKGEISAKDKIVTDEKYAYLIKLRTSPSFDKKHYFRLLTESGIEVYEAAEKITLNDAKPKPADDVVISAELFSNGVIDKDGNQTEQQLIKFKTDRNGKLNFIRTYQDHYTQYEKVDSYYKKDKNKEDFTLDYDSGTGYLTYYGNPVKIFGSRFLADANTKVFFVPTMPSEDLDEYISGTITSLSSSTKYYNLQLYNVSYGNMVESVVIKKDGAGSASITSSDPNMVISKITQVYNKETEATDLKITGYVRGVEKVYLCDDTTMKDTNASYGNGLGISDLKPGDVIQVALDSKGYIEALRILNCYNPKTFTYRETSTSTTSIYTALHSGIGNMIYRDDLTYIFNCTAPNPATGLQDRLRDRAFNFTSRTFFYKVDIKTGRVREIKAADIPEGALVYLRSGYCYLNDVVYYE